MPLCEDKGGAARAGMQHGPSMFVALGSRVRGAEADCQARALAKPKEAAQSSVRARAGLGGGRGRAAKIRAGVMWNMVVIQPKRRQMSSLQKQ